MSSGICRDLLGHRCVPRRSHAVFVLRDVPRVEGAPDEPGVALATCGGRYAIQKGAGLAARARPLASRWRRWPRSVEVRRNDRAGYRYDVSVVTGEPSCE